MLFLEVSFTDYILALYVFCWLYVLSSLFLAPIKRLDCRNKLVSPCRDCPTVVLSGSPFPSPGDISPISLHGILQARVLEWSAIAFSARTDKFISAVKSSYRSKEQRA